MSLGPGSLNLFLPLIERLTRLPGRALVAGAGVSNLLLLVISWFAARSSSSAGTWIPFAMGLVFSAILVFFALRRARLEKLLDIHTAKLRERYMPNPARELGAQPGSGVVIDEKGRYQSEGLRYEAERLQARQRQADAEVAASIRKDTFLSRLEAAQRAAIAQAGGVENVPHLKDDLRWTILSAGITLVSLPVIGFLIIVSIFLLFSSNVAHMAG